MCTTVISPAGSAISLTHEPKIFFCYHVSFFLAPTQLMDTKHMMMNLNYMLVHKGSTWIPCVENQKLFDYITFHYYSHSACLCSSHLEFTLLLTNNTKHHYLSNNIRLVIVICVQAKLRFSLWVPTLSLEEMWLVINGCSWMLRIESDLKSCLTKCRCLKNP